MDNSKYESLVKTLISYEEMDYIVDFIIFEVNKVEIDVLKGLFIRFMNELKNTFENFEYYAVFIDNKKVTIKALFVNCYCGVDWIRSRWFELGGNGRVIRERVDFNTSRNLIIYILSNKNIVKELKSKDFILDDFYYKILNGGLLVIYDKIKQ